jgi:hypothetical protein
MLQAVDDNTLLSHDDGIAAGQFFEHSKSTTAVTSSKQQHVTATAGSNGSADAAQHSGNGTHAGTYNGSSNGTNAVTTATTSATTDVAGLGLKDLLGAHAATQVLTCLHLHCIL